MEYFDVVGVRDVDDGRLHGCRLAVIEHGLLNEISSDQVRETWMSDPMTETVEALWVVWD